jgi:hypothetical protein
MRLLLSQRPAGRRAAAGTVSGTAAALVASALMLAACGSVVANGTAPPGAGASSPRGTLSPSGTPPARAPGTPAAGADACATAHLKVAITHSGALAGQAGGYLMFTNEGSTACQMTGWPTVVALTAAGEATTLRHAHSTMYGAWHAPAPLPVVQLPPGGSAYAVVAADDQPAGASTGCPAPFVRLRVSPPGSSASLTVSAWLAVLHRDGRRACGRDLRGHPAVRPAALACRTSLRHRRPRCARLATREATASRRERAAEPRLRR